MNILHIVTLVDEQQSYGGPVTVATGQLKALNDRGHRVLLVAGWNGVGRNPRSVDGVAARLQAVRSWFPKTRFSGLMSIRLALTIVRAVLAADVVHIHFARDLIPLLASLVCRATGTPYVVQTHGMVLPKTSLVAKVLDRLLTIPGLAGARACLTLTPDEAQALRECAGGAIRIQEIRNGVPSLQATSEVNDPLDVLFLARLHPRKRVSDFAAAAALYGSADDLPAARFSVVGPDDGDLSTLENALETTPNLYYEGALSHTAAQERIQAADLYVLPSEAEVFPMSVLEAMASGTATILTTSCGIAPELKHAQAARVVNPRDPEGLFQTIRELAEDRGALNRLARNGQVYAETYFSLDSVAASLEKHYVRARSDDGASLLWVTNIAPDYRVALWKALSTRLHLNVLTLDREAQTPWQKVGMPPADSHRFTMEPLRLRSIRATGRPLHIPNFRLLYLALPFRRDHVVMDGWDSPAYLLLRLSAPFRRGKSATFYRGTLATQNKQVGPASWLRRWFFTGMDVIFVGGASSAQAVSLAGVPDSRIVIVGNPVDNEYFAKAVQLRDAASDKNAQNAHRFIYVGQFITRKNIAGLIRAFASARGPNDRLELVGDGPEQPVLRELVTRLGLDDFVTMTGPLTGQPLLAAYARSHTLVLPSTEEVWGLVVNEALVAGLQVVVSDKCGVAAELQDCDVAYVTHVDLDSLSATLKSAKQNHPGIVGHEGATRWSAEASAQIIATSLGCE